MDLGSLLKDPNRQTPDWVGTSACSVHLLLRINKDIKTMNVSYVFSMGFSPKDMNTGETETTEVFGLYAISLQYSKGLAPQIMIFPLYSILRLSEFVLYHKTILQRSLCATIHSQSAVKFSLCFCGNP